MPLMKRKKVKDAEDQMVDGMMPKKMADGGMVERPSSMAMAVMQKRKANMAPASGDDGDGLNDYDEQNAEAGMKELYDDQDLNDFPMVPGSSEIGDEREADRQNKLGMVQSIRAKLKAKRGF